MTLRLSDRLGVAARVVVGRAVAPWLLQRLSLPQIVSLVGADGLADDGADLDDVAAVSAAVAAVAADVDAIAKKIPRGRGTCLQRAIARLWAARAVGVPAALVIGVRRAPGGDVEAHAWLELAGALYLEDDPLVPPQFQRIYDSRVVGAGAPDAAWRFR